MIVDETWTAVMFDGHTEEVSLRYGVDLLYHWSVGKYEETHGTCSDRDEAFVGIATRLANMGGYLEMVARGEPNRSELIAENTKLRRVAVATSDLVLALPKCDQCGEPATRAWKRGEARYCDTHGSDVREYPRAVPLRAVMAALKAALDGYEPMAVQTNEATALPQANECYTMVLRDGQRIPVTIDPSPESDHHGPITLCQACMDDLRITVLAQYGSEIERMEQGCGCGRPQRLADA